MRKFYSPLFVGLFYFLLFIAFFSPVLFSDRLLAPGDGLIYYLPNFYAGRTLWEPLLYSGAPAAADSQTMTWYPLSLLFSVFDAWNWFVVAAYVLAGCFTSGYVYLCTRSGIAGLVGGLTYSMSGPIMAHLGHTSIIHSAVWPPLLLWALEKIRLRFDLRWIVVGSVAIGCGILAGHPQIFVYFLGVSFLYVLLLGWNAASGRWRYYGASVGLLLLGLGLAAILLLPAAQLASLSLRSQMSFEEFVSYSLSPRQSLELLFPYLWGGARGSFYGVYYWGEWNLAELTGYIGLLPLFLAAICLYTRWRNTFIVFWAGVGVLSFLLTLGSHTPLAYLMYHFPIYNKFRCPARHFFEFALALSILAGYGAAILEKREASRRLIATVIGSVVCFMLILVTATSLFSHVFGFSTKVGIGSPHFFSLRSPAVVVPFGIVISSGAALYWWSKQVDSALRRAVLLLALIIDLGSFGWFYEWQFAAPEIRLLSPPVMAERYGENLRLASQRELPVRGGTSTWEELPVNLSRLWRVSSASGYGPLLLSRVSQLLSMGADGRLADVSLAQTNRSLDILAVRYLLLPRQKALPTSLPDSSVQEWAPEDLSVALGGEKCGGPLPATKEFDLPHPVEATAIGVVSALACSVDILSGEEILQIELQDERGGVQTQTLRAGKDTAEWAYDCPDVFPKMQHTQAAIFDSFFARRANGASCDGHQYVAVLPLKEAARISKIHLRWSGHRGVIRVNKISLFDEHSHQTYALSPLASLLADQTRWSHVEDIEETSIYENLRARPRAWLVSEVVTATPDQVLQAFHTSRLPDGREFDPSNIALVEEPVQFHAPPLSQKATAQVVHISNTSVEVQTSSDSPAFLVLSDIYYPGWQATIDGTPTHLFQTNYVLRGVIIPAGGHVVKFDFRPTPFYAGFAISALSVMIGGALLYRGRKSNSL